MPLFNRRGATAVYAASGEISATVDGVTTTIGWSGSGSFGDVQAASRQAGGAHG